MLFLFEEASTSRYLQPRSLPTRQNKLAEFLAIKPNRVNQWIKSKGLYPPPFFLLNLSRLYGFGPSDEFILKNEHIVSLKEVVDFLVSKLLDVLV